MEDKLIRRDLRIIKTVDTLQTSQSNRNAYNSNEHSLFEEKGRIHN